MIRFPFETREKKNDDDDDSGGKDVEVEERKDVMVWASTRFDGLVKIPYVEIRRWGIYETSMVFGGFSFIFRIVPSPCK